MVWQFRRAEGFGVCGTTSLSGLCDISFSGYAAVCATCSVGGGKTVMPLLLLLLPPRRSSDSASACAEARRGKGRCFSAESFFSRARERLATFATSDRQRVGGGPAAEFNLAECTYSRRRVPAGGCQQGDPCGHTC